MFFGEVSQASILLLLLFNHVLYARYVAIGTTVVTWPALEQLANRTPKWARGLRWRGWGWVALRLFGYRVSPKAYTDSSAGAGGVFLYSGPPWPPRPSLLDAWAGWLAGGPFLSACRSVEGDFYLPFPWKPVRPYKRQMSYVPRWVVQTRRTRPEETVFPASAFRNNGVVFSVELEWPY